MSTATDISFLGKLDDKKQNCHENHEKKSYQLYKKSQAAQFISSLAKKVTKKEKPANKDHRSIKNMRKSLSIEEDTRNGENEEWQISLNISTT